MQLALAENQSSQNLKRDKQDVAVYAAVPGTGAEDKPYAVSGARIRFRLVEDEALFKAFQGDFQRPALYGEFAEVLLLG